MRTITIEIINEKVLSLLKDLELLKLIRLHKTKPKTKVQSNWLAYKGAMKKQSIEEVDNQIEELREEWK